MMLKVFTIQEYKASRRACAHEIFFGESEYKRQSVFLVTYTTDGASFRRCVISQTFKTQEHPKRRIELCKHP